MTIEKITFGPTGYRVGIEYSHKGRSFRMRTCDAPREGLFVSARKATEAALRYRGFPGDLSVGISSFTFAEGSDPGTSIVLEGMHAKLALDKIDSREVTRKIKTGPNEWSLEYDEDDPRNLFNVEIRELVEEIVFFVNGQRIQLQLEFNEELANEIRIVDPLATEPHEAAPA